MENILNMHNTDLTFHRLGQTILACGRIRVMLSKSAKINIYKKKKILPVIYYGCETWSVIQRERMRFENGAPRNVLSLKRDEVKGVFKKRQ